MKIGGAAGRFEFAPTWRCVGVEYIHYDPDSNYFHNEQVQFRSLCFWLGADGGV